MSKRIKITEEAMKKTLIESFALGTAGVVLCLGCQSVVPSASGPTTPPTGVKKPDFEHAKEVDDYLVAVRKFMLVAPRDGRFAETRVAHFREGVKHEINGYKNMEQIGKDNNFMSFVVGISPCEWKNLNVQIQLGRSDRCNCVPMPLALMQE